MSPDSPENKCPRCGSEDPLIVGEACGYHPLHTPHRWHVEAPRVGGSGRINTSGDFIGDKPGQGEHSCHENCPCSPSPDRETGRDARSDSEGELRTRIEELAEKYEEVAALALGFASEKVSCSSVASDLRSLLVPKEEA